MNLHKQKSTIVGEAKYNLSSLFTQLYKFAMSTELANTKLLQGKVQGIQRDTGFLRAYGHILSTD